MVCDNQTTIAPPSYLAGPKFVEFGVFALVFPVFILTSAVAVPKEIRDHPSNVSSGEKKGSKESVVSSSFYLPTFTINISFSMARKKITISLQIFGMEMFLQ